ncbi:T9SS type B sorting domain-containing protein [uncultured Winogradskyella sp.]|uniref:T9SS type B sorting domain-containing protein n=1 Tax=uncultured Winogradskyella sp. TaxID=395353 RepID=UPI00262CF797|nr:T9SS type B sorting domain-containing protein [uncultured Winogradskyella sp.]
MINLFERARKMAQLFKLLTMQTINYKKGIILTVFLLLLSILGYAQTYEPFTIRKQIETKGSMMVIGNNILGKDNLPGNDNSIDNQDISMQYIDIDGDPTTFNSSSADIVLPLHDDGSSTTCYGVAYAGLYWGSILQDGDRTGISNVKFKLPSSTSYLDITGELIYDAIANPIISENGEPGNTPYAAYADVTDLLNGLTDIEGTYSVANVISSQGTNFSTGLSAGWTLIVIYEDQALHMKSFTTFDGFSHIYNDHYEEIPVSGFTTPPAGHIDLQFAYAVLDGDKNNRATKLEINNKEVTTPLRPANKFFGAVIENNNGIVLPRNPLGTNTLGYDTGYLEVLNSEPEYVRHSDTSASFTLQVARGQADPLFSFFSAFAVDIISPEITLVKIVEDEFGNEINGDTVILGQNLFYEISYQNTGNEDVTNFTITDVLPDNVIFDPATDFDLSNSGGATLQSYDPATNTIVFSIPDESVEFGDPEFVIRIAVQVVLNCYDLSQACSNEISNQAFGDYEGALSGIAINDEGSYTKEECFGVPQPTNFLVDISNCNFERDEVLCGTSIDIEAADGYDSYSWSNSPTGSPIIGTNQIYTATEPGTYYVTNTTDTNCISIEEIINVVLYGETQTNPIIPFADEVVICPNDGKPLPNIFLCGANDTRTILTGISDAASIIWEQLDENSCPAVSNSECANENDTCNWNQIATGPDYIANTAGQFRLVINYPGGCFSIFYFNVYQNLLNPTAVAQDIICDTSGQITVNGVPSGYEYSIDGTNYQPSPIFAVNSAGYYIIYIRQIGVDTNPCIFETPNVHVQERNFTVTTTITQPDCHGEFGSINLAVNNALPQYYFSIYQGSTLVNNVGPTNSSNYEFNALNAGIYTINASTDDGCIYTETIEIIEPPLLSVTAAITVPLTCDNGEITIYPEGGTPPYFYYINSTSDFQTFPEYEVTAAGTYNITVVDTNNCSASTSIIVDGIPEPEFTISTNTILCGEPGDTGTLTVNVTNAYGSSIQYSIDNGATFLNSNVFNGLTAGDYTVILQYSIGNSVCLTDPQTDTITANAAISGTAELTTPYSCLNLGTITVTSVSGGDAPYDYSIDGINFQTSNTFSDLDQGSYTIIIRDDNDCTSITNDIVIDVLDPPTDLEFDSSTVTCPTNTANITITSTTGGTGNLEYQIIAPSTAVTSYQFSTLFSGLEPGTYTFQVKDENDCTYSESYTIDPIPTPTLNVVLTEILDCSASPDAIFTGTITGTAPYTYAVSFNGGSYTDLGTTGTPFTYTTSNNGTYQFQITDANGCIAESSELILQPLSPPALSLVAESQSILCNGDSNGAIEITIDTSVGTPPFEINVTNDTTSTDFGMQTSGLPAGTYTVTLTDSKSCTATETITINEPNPIIVDYDAVDITCDSGGASQGSVIVNSVAGGTAPYNYFVTGTNGYSNSELNTTGSTSVSFDVVDFGLYQINIVDANGCSLLIQDVLVASPPTDLDIDVSSIVDCVTGGEAVVSIGSTLVSTGPFFFSIYQGPTSIYPNPLGSWIPEDSPGSQSATFTGLTPGVIYTFIVYDQSTNCSYYEPATTPIPTNSTLTATALTSNNITCTGSADGNVSFVINNGSSNSIDVSYEIFDSLSFTSTGIIGTGTIPANGTLNVSDLGPLAFGNYFVNIIETFGANAGCGIITETFNITESAIPLDLFVSVDQSANCSPTSGVVSAIAQNGTAPYQYQISTSATAPTASDTNWTFDSVFNVDAGDYYVYTIDAYGCIISSPLTIVPTDPIPVISAVVNNQCTATEGNYEIDVTLDTAGVPPYSYSIDGGVLQIMTAPFTIPNLFSGVHTIEIQDASGCGNLISVDIVAPLFTTPEATVIPTCNNDDGEITLTTTGGSGTFNYSISPNPASISLSSNVFSGVPSGLYNITVTDIVTSCTKEVTISLPEATIPSFILTPTEVTCFGDNSGSLDIDITNYTGTYTYEVFDSSNTSVTGLVNAITSSNPQTVTGIEAGTFTVVITETEIPFCSNTSDVVIASPIEALALTISETSNVTCNDNEGTISAVASGGWGSFEYELTGDAIVGYSSENTFTGLSAGSYTVNVRDAGGCIVSETITLDAPTPINATFAANMTTLACFGDQNANITVSNVTGGQGSNYSYTLNTISPIASSSGPQLSNVFQNLGAGTYSVIIKDGYDCEFLSLDIIISEPTPIEVSLVKATAQTCLNESTLTLSATGGTGSYTYSDDPSFSNILGTFSSSTTFSVPNGTYSYYVRDTNGCITNASNEITIEPLPELTVTLETSNLYINCSGDNNGSISASALGGLGDYIYTLQDGSGSTITATQDSPGYFTELFAGDYIVLVESGDCSITSAPISITEPSAPLDAAIVVNNVTCSSQNNGSVEITTTGGTGNIRYAISPQLNQFFETNVFENLAPGNYELIVQDELGCFLTFDFIVSEPELVIISIISDSIFPEVCAGDQNGEFSIAISGGTLPYSVSLDDYNGIYTTGTATQTEFDFTNLAGGDHIVYIRDAEGCESEWNITFPESVSINPEVIVETACDDNNSISIVTVSVDDSITDLSDLDYSLDGGPYQASNVFNNIPIGTDHYIEVRHTNGCIQITDFFDIGSYDTVTLSLANGDLNEIIANASGGTGDYKYTMDGEDYGNENNFIITESGIHTVTVTDSSGCFATAQIELEFIDICIPNWFTPNGDGEYDTWAPGCTENYPNLTFDIFDRYGRKVASYRVGGTWDGRYNGQELPTGDYWYVVKTNDTIDREFVGHFTLYR